MLFSAEQKSIAFFRLRKEIALKGVSANMAIIRMLLDDFHQSVLPAVSQGLVGRDLSLGKPVRPKMGSTAEVVVGVRRSGKTFRLHQEMLRLMESGVPVDRICYLSFDDDRLRPCEDGLAGRVLEVFFEEHPRARRPAGTGQGAARSPTSTA